MSTPAPNLSAARAAVAAAKATLLDCLRNELDIATTATARAALDAAKVELSAAEGADAAATLAAEAEARAAEAAHVEADAVAAAAAAFQVEARVAEAVAAVAPPAGTPDLLPAPAVPEIVARAAGEVSRAAAALERARVPLRAAQADRQLLAGRLAAKGAKSAAIRSRRLAGDAHDSDAAELALLTSDETELRGAIADADARVIAAQPDEHLVRLHRDAEAALFRAQQQAVLDGMADRMRALESAIVAGARALRAAGLQQSQTGFFNMGSHWIAGEDLKRIVQGWGV